MIRNTARAPVYRIRDGENTIEEALGTDAAEVSAGPLGGFKDILRLALAISRNYFMRETQEERIKNQGLSRS